ncbi:MAG: hypothetical protein LBL66_00530, partial [Clostridiales bacterium]|nr:hypothetical protein [Clostridiales bacterium]
MKTKELFRIAKISLAARKKSTRNTVRGIAFGLILLIPVLFIATGVFGDLNNKINKNPEVLYAEFPAAAARAAVRDKEQGENPNDYQISYGTAKSIFDKIQTPEKIIYEQVTAKFNYNVMTARSETGEAPVFDFTFNDADGSPSSEMSHLYVDEVKFKEFEDDGKNSLNAGLEPEYSKTSFEVPFAAIMDLDASGRVDFTPAKYAKKFGGIFVPGCGAGFTNGGKGQVVLSETFVKAIGGTAAGVYGKNFTIRYENSNTDRIFINPDSVVNDNFVA